MPVPLGETQDNMTKIKMMICAETILFAAALICVPRSCAQNAEAAEETGPYGSLEIRGGYRN